VLSNQSRVNDLNKRDVLSIIYAPEEVKAEIKDRLANGEDITAAEIRRLKLANDSLKLTSTSLETYYANNAISTSHA
jgi:hypothetical protein